MTETCKISELLPNPYNREIDPDKVSRIKSEIQRTGEVYPLVYSEVDNDGKPGKMVTDGHHRFVALKELGHTDVPVILSDERGLKTKAPKEDVKKYIRHEGSKWVVHSESGKRLGTYDSKEGAVKRLGQIEYFKTHKMSQEAITTEAKDLAKAWFGDPEGHAEAARHEGVTTGSESKTGMHDGIKTAIKVAAIGALAVGGIAALRSSAGRNLIANASKAFMERFPASSVGRSTYAATLANGGHTVSMVGEIPNARYMVSPYKVNEKIIPVGQFKAHSVDAYTKQNANLLAQPNHHLGTWHNKETGNVHLDVSLPHDNRLAALETGQKHGQLAIYDRVAGRDIPVNPETIAQAKFVETIRGAHEAAPHSWNPHVSKEGGFGTDTLTELSQAVKTGQSSKPVRLLYNAKNGNFIVGPFESSHELMLTQVPGTPGELDRHWARMVYHPEQAATGKAGKLELWDWSTAADEAKGTAARNYADTAEAIMRNKAFTDETRFSIHEPFKQNAGRPSSDSLEGVTHTLGEWRQLYGKSVKGMIVYDIDSIMKNSKEITPKEEVTIPNRTAMAASEQAEHPTLSAPVIAQIVEDHLKSGKDIIYKRALASAVAHGLAKVYREKPTEVSAQPNTQESIEQVQSIDENLVALHGALQELEMLARDQQLLSEDEMQCIILPLQEKISSLLNAMNCGIIEESASSSQNPTESSEVTADLPEETNESTEAEQPTEVPDDSAETSVATDKPEEDPQRKRKTPQGPKRKPGTDTAARELTEPATDFTGKVSSNKDIHKGFFGLGSGRGWRGDPEGHAEAARERWAGMGVPPGGAQKPVGTPRQAGAQKPTGAQQPGQTSTRPLSDTALVLPKAVKDMAVVTAGRAGRGIARFAGDAIAEIGWQAFGTVAGIIAFRYLSGSSTNVAAMLSLGKEGLKQAVNRSLELQRISSLARKMKLERVINWAKTAGKIGARDL